jgi:hypothetical protein
MQETAWYILGSVIFVATILITVFDKQIVQWLTPAGRWMRECVRRSQAGEDTLTHVQLEAWMADPHRHSLRDLIPSGASRDGTHPHRADSSAQLFGHEIVAILVGVIWGLGVGFAIVAAGTFVGEIGNY